MTQVQEQRAQDRTDAAERWLELFFRFFAAPSPESYRPLFHPEGSLLDAGMAAPLPAAQTGEAIAMVLAKLPDLKIRPLRHRIRGSHVFVEARNTGTLNGEALDWGAVYRVHLRDGLVHRGRRFYDQMELFRPLLPAGAGLPPFPAGPAEPVAQAAAPRRTEDLVECLAAAWAAGDFAALAALHAPEGRLLAPGLAAPVPRERIPAWGRWFSQLVAPRAMRVVDWAGGGDTLFVEWEVEAEYAGAPVRLDRIDRLLLDGQGRIVESRAYFDTLALAAREDPAVERIRAAVIKG